MLMLVKLPFGLVCWITFPNVAGYELQNISFLSFGCLYMGCHDRYGHRRLHQALLVQQYSQTLQKVSSPYKQML